jgi:hypothetical protein
MDLAQMAIVALALSFGAMIFYGTYKLSEE